MRIVTVIPLEKGAFKENLTYFSSKNIPDGSIVTVPMRNKQILGLAVSSEKATDTKSDIKNLTFNLKKITEVKENSIFLKEYIESTLDISKYFATRKNDAIVTLIPSIFREEYDKISKIKNETKEIENISINIKKEKLLFQYPLADRISFYKTLIRGSFAEKKSVFIVLPTEIDIESFSKTLSKGIENFSFTMYAGLGPKKILKKFEEIITSSHPVLVFGTTPFLSIPRRDFGTIILEYESSNAYKMMNRPYFDLRSFVELYASKISAKLIFGDSLLRFETIARKEMDNFSEVHPLSFRINFEGEIKIPEPARNAFSIADAGGKKFEVLKTENITEIQDVILKNESVFIFSLRKGLATETLCRDCNEPVMCTKCSVPVVLYLSRDGKKRMFACNRCNTEKDPETRCLNCNSWNLMPLGIGTDTVFEEAQKLFPETKIFKLDKESAKTTKGAIKIIKEFEENPGSILVGTEMALLYIKEHVDLSVIASFDSLWSVPSFKMNEKIIQLIFSIISKTKDKLIIQTKNKQDPAIHAVETENILSFVREELEDRKNLNYPPFKRFIKVTHMGNKEDSIHTKKALEEVFKDYDPEIFSGFVSKIKDKYVTNMLIKMDTKKWSLPELSTNSKIDEKLLEKLLLLPREFSVNIDPENLL
ncbi:MAG: hypothetical protein WAV23_01370 [Minisyncoccia bacterium]